VDLLGLQRMALRHCNKKRRMQTSMGLLIIRSAMTAFAARCPTISKNG